MGCSSTANNKKVNLLREEKVFDISSVFIHSHGIFDKLLCFMSFVFSLSHSLSPLSCSLISYVCNFILKEAMWENMVQNEILGIGSEIY